MSQFGSDQSKPSVAILGSRGIPARYGGFERFAEELSVRLASRGVEVAVYAEGTRTSREHMYRGVRVIPIPFLRWGSLSTIIFDLRCLIHASRRYSVVYMLGYGAAVFFPLVRHPIWVNMDGLEWARPKWHWAGRAWLRAMEAIAVRSAQLVICDADAIKESLHRRHGRDFPSSCISYGATICNEPPNAAVLSRFGLTPGSYHLVVCRVEPENHVREILLGYSIFPSTKCLVIVGDVTGTDRYHRELMRHASERIRFVGAVYDADVLKALRVYCATYCHGHSVGGTNPSLLEAMASGSIVVAHDNKFNREVCGEEGLYWGTPDQLKDRLVEAESMNRNLRVALQSRMKDRVAARYDWEKVTDRYLGLLNGELS